LTTTPNAPGPPERSLRLNQLMFWVAACALLFWLIVLGRVFLTVIIGSILFWMACAVGIAVIVVRRRTTLQLAFLSWLAIATARGVPLPQAVESFVEQCRGRYRRRLLAVWVALRRGATVPEALNIRGVLPNDARVLVWAGCATDDLPGALLEAAALRAEHQSFRGPLASRLAYLLFVLLFLQTISGLVLYFIIPKYEAIFRDFGVSLPESTRMVIHLGHLLGESAWGVLLLVLEAIFLVYLPFAVVGQAGRGVPLADRLFLRRHAALALRVLARFVERGRPLGEGLGALAETYPSRSIRRRLRRAADDLEGGAHWCTSLHARGLIRDADAAVLESAQRAGNLPWALRETAESSERRLRYRLQAWIQVLFPVAVIALGCLVFLIVVAYFQPLVTLIEALTEWS
jgi:type II secretory pathway component PulF